MYLIPIAWIYVALMMAVAEANHVQGTVLGAVFTFLLYGVAPVSLLMYFIGRPRRRARAAAAAAAVAAAEAAPASGDPDARGKPAADAVPAVRKEP